MDNKDKKSRSSGTLLAIVVGLAAGLILGIAATFFASPEPGAPDRVDYTDRWGIPRSFPVGNTAPYVVLPVVGAFVGFIYAQVRNVFRKK
jgi:hypothetical protein